MADVKIDNINPLYYQDATTLATLIRTKQVSSREVVQAHLDRVLAVNPRINAVVTLMGEAALEAADLADTAVARGAALGPLHGVPFSIKDALDTFGVLTQRGSKLFEGNVPTADATAVSRFKAAGAIPLMKTNLPEFSAWTETDNLVTGRTNNLWKLDRTPGGSSGGESAAIAAGMSPIGIGSDVAISVRGPAAFTGIAALKATRSRSLYGSLSLDHQAVVACRRDGPHRWRRRARLLAPEEAGRRRRVRCPPSRCRCRRRPDRWPTVAYRLGYRCRLRPGGSRDHRCRRFGRRSPCRPGT